MRHLQREDDHRRAEAITNELRRLASKGDHKEAIALGRLLHEAKSSELWRQKADTWKEYIGEIGLSTSMDFQARTNYELYVLKLGVDPSDPRLSAVEPSKLFAAARLRYRQWIADNLDEFFESARRLTREDLRTHLEEQAGGITATDDDPARDALRAIREATMLYGEMSEEVRDAFVDELWEDRTLRDGIASILSAVDKWDEDIEVPLAVAASDPDVAEPTTSVAPSWDTELEVLERRILSGDLAVDQEGNLVSRNRDGNFEPIGHTGNTRGNRRITFRGEGGKHPLSVQAQRVAWRVHHGHWPPKDMSVMMVNGDKGDFRIENLALVYRGQERRASATMQVPTRGG